MPHIPEVRPTSHDRHDSMLVAALAAGDLAGTERDQAIALTTDCSDCAQLRDDVLAIAVATAAAPAPIGFPSSARDFRLTPADAARLRPAGWRRLAGLLTWPRTVVTRPLGVGLATLGLVGLLVGNVNLSLGGTGASPDSRSLGGQPVPAGVAAPGAAAPEGGQGAVPAASSAPAYVQGGPADTSSSAAPAVIPENDASAKAAIPAASGAPVFGAVGDTSATHGPSLSTEQQAVGAANVPGDAATAEPQRPLNILFGAVLIAGLGVLLVSFRRGRPAA